MALITLTTDFGTKDYSVAAVKGAIYNALPDARTIDITHEISPFHIMEAAYIIQNAYRSFPKGTIHIIGIDSELHPENKHLAILLDGHYFICADNGLMGLLTSMIKPEKIVEIDIGDSNRSNFPVLDVFIVAACHIARGGTLGVIGKEINSLTTFKSITPITNVGDKQIVGSVIYIDNYGNIVTNITRKLFENTRKGREFKITARSAIFKAVHERYSDAINFAVEPSRREEDGKKVAIFNSGDFLELAIYKSNPKTVGSAASLFGMRYRDPVNVYFV